MTLAPDADSTFCSDMARSGHPACLNSSSSRAWRSLSVAGTLSLLSRTTDFWAGVKRTFCAYDTAHNTKIRTVRRILRKGEFLNFKDIEIWEKGQLGTSYDCVQSN